MKNIITWLSEVLKDESGNPSSKRVVGVICALTLCVTMYSNSFTEAHFAPSRELVDAVALLAFGCLGLSSVDKIWGKKKEGEE
jgi:hypothetical protein